MREIKFRAFHKVRREYDYSEYGSGGWWGDCVIDCPKDYEIIQQYTGLKDKNGKEIYEGDVVTHPYNPEETITMTLDPHQIHQLIEFGEWDMFNRSEVIGNIYENPELLTNN